MDRQQQRKIVEVLIIAAGEPVTPARLADIVPGLTPARARELVAELTAEYEASDRALEIWEVAGGYQLRTRSGYAGYVRQLHRERPLRLSRAALETLSVVAYKQPVTRAEVEHIRGVDVGAVLRSLMDRKLVKIAGHREVPGRPMLYGTTRRFLEVFGLVKLDDLPTLREIEELVASSDTDEAVHGGAAADETTESELADEAAADLGAETLPAEPTELH